MIGELFESLSETCGDLVDKIAPIFILIMMAAVVLTLIILPILWLKGGCK